MKKYSQYGLVMLLSVFLLSVSCRNSGVTSKGQGGEYPGQDGFGWTNGVLQKLMAEYHIHK